MYKEIIEQIIENGKGFDLYNVCTGEYHAHRYASTNTRGVIITPPLFEIKALQPTNPTPAFRAWYEARVEITRIHEDIQREEDIRDLRQHRFERGLKYMITDRYRQNGGEIDTVFEKCLSMLLYFEYMEKPSREPNKQ